MAGAGAISGPSPSPALGPQRYGMVVDINRCVGCQTCTISCKHVNDTPPGVQWRRVLDVERGTFPDVERLFLVVGCQHCAEPPCVPVCPTGATQQREDGLVTMDYDQCIGCGYCAVACPYQARTIMHDKRWYYGEPTRQEEAVSHDDRLGVATKCTFCIEKVDDAKRTGATAGVDLGLTPACAASCIAQAITFGDFNDAKSGVSALIRENAHFQMHEELGTDPQIKYLYEVPNATPGQAAAPEDIDDDKMRDLENPLVGRRQTLWDFRAAMNFTLGGMSAGLVVIAFVFSGFGVVSTATLTALNITAGLGMAIGLGSVFLEIGRKSRFLYVLRRPQSSWMSRETYAVAVFYPAIGLAAVNPIALWFGLAASAAAAFLFCQARILYMAKGIPAWRAPAVPWLVVATGLLEGVALLSIYIAISGNPAAWPFSGGTRLVPDLHWVAGAGGALTVVTMVIWQSYCANATGAGIGPLARDQLLRLDPWLRWGGYALPAGGFAVAAALGIENPAAAGVLAVSGALSVAGGSALKITLIVRACHEQGFAIPRMPQRGSGQRAAPVRLDPAGSRVT